MITLFNDNCLDAIRSLPDNSVDSIVTDPPYGLSFMGKKWDYDVPSVEIWAECLRVLKPGGHLLAFAGTRTQHRMAVRIEDAGFEIRDMLAWVYGSGFPKSHDVSKAIDKAAGAEREVVGVKKHSANQQIETFKNSGDYKITTPTTKAAKQWQGWGTALKPALEPITLARKPLIGTVAENVLEHGTGGLNIDGCRVENNGDDLSRKATPAKGWKNSSQFNGSMNDDWKKGRWPANFIHDGSDEVVGLFPHTSSGAVNPHINGSVAAKTVVSFLKGLDGKMRNYTSEANQGSASRFFYCAKASKRDRDEGLEGFPTSTQQSVAHGDRQYGTLPHTGEQREINSQPRANIHPTVKPTDLMRYLCRLITPPNGVILDPFMGSGSTGKAALLEGFSFIGCELSPEYFEIAKARIEAKQDLFT